MVGQRRGLDSLWAGQWSRGQGLLVGVAKGQGLANPWSPRKDRTRKAHGVGVALTRPGCGGCGQGAVGVVWAQGRPGTQ